MEKINVAKLLKDCPKGMELNCLIYDNVYFDCIREHKIYPIVCYTVDSKGKKEEITFNWYGKYMVTDTAKCVIFPKGKTTWEGFVSPCKFKDGDVLAESSCIFIIQKLGDNNTAAKTYCTLYSDGIFDDGTILYFNIDSTKHATEEEKQKLFDAIKANGYKWNAETKTLEQLNIPKFHEGDWITNGEYTWKVISVDYLDYTLQNQWGECVYDTINYVNKAFHLWTINDAKDGDVLFHSDSASNGIFIFKEILQRGTIQKVICYCDYDSEDGFCLGENHTCCWTDSTILHPATKEQCDTLFQKMQEAGYKWNVEIKTLEKLVEPRFKVGDRIFYALRKHMGVSEVQCVISDITDDRYFFTDGSNMSISTQNNWELVPNKFDINTLIPFESKVLVRDYDNEIWRVSFWGCLINCEYSFKFKYDTTRGCYKQCIPYEGNEYLLGKKDDCKDFYKTW